MNRQIKFRGLHKVTNKWVYGDLEHLPNGNIHIFGNHYSQPVIESSVGQFTGLTDKNGTDIYEGDIIRIDCHPWLDWKELESVNAEVLFEGFAFIAQWKNPDAGKPFGAPGNVEPEYVADILSNLPNTIEVIGNIHDDKIKEE